MKVYLRSGLVMKRWCAIVVGLGLGYSRQALLPPVGRLAWMRLAWALAEQVRRPSGLQTWQC